VGSLVATARRAAATRRAAIISRFIAALFNAVVPAA